MNNVNNRKLFRKSQSARNKLREIGGIMASDAELMQTVAKFALGGPVPLVDAEDVNVINYPRVSDRYRYDRLRNRPPGALTREEQVQLQEFQQRFGVEKPQGFPAKIDQFISDLFPTPPRPAEEIQMFGRGVDAEDVNVKSAQRAGTEADQQYSNQLIDPYFQDITAPQSPSDFRMPGVTPAPETQEKPVVTPKPVLGDGAARDDGRAPMAATDPQMIAAKKGELGTQKQVEAIVNTGTQEEQQEQLKQLMSEFTQNAPEYEGMDKGLAIAKIGFAMAAGKSSNAISNIATALEQGADMFIKDKNDRDAFNRQVQLSALQYGLGEQSKDRAAKRSMEYQTADYVLMPGESYTYPDGRTVTADPDKDGITISLNKSEVLAKGLPDGVQGTSLATSILSKKATLEAAAAKAIKDANDKITVNDPKKIGAFVDDYSAAANNAIQANNAMHLTKQVMVMNADGKITGFRPGFNSALANAMALAGVDATSYTDRDLAIADLRKVFQKLVPLTLGKDQSANSISNKDVDRLADAYMSAGILDGGIMALMTTPANVLNSKLSGILVEFQNAEDEALAKLTSLEETGAEFITPSGRKLGSRVDAQRSRVQEVFPQKGTRPMLAIGEDGVFRPVTGG